MQLLLDNAVDPNQKNLNGPFPLNGSFPLYEVLSRTQNYKELGELLVEKGADTNLTTHNGFTPLHLATTLQDSEKVKFLLDHGADPNKTDNENNTPLDIAAQEKNYEIAELLSNTINILCAPLVASNQDLKMMKLLLEQRKLLLKPKKDSKTYPSKIDLDIPNTKDKDLKTYLPKIDLNIKDKDGYTALHWATTNQQLEMMRLLLENGADPNIAITKSKKTALWLAIERQLATKRNPAVQLLLNYNAMINKRNSDEWTLLYFSIYEKHDCITTVDLLLTNGADPNILCGQSTRQTALQLAIERKKERVVNSLISCKANVNQYDTADPTCPPPLHLATQKNEHDIMYLLLEHGANPNMIFCEHLPAHYAIENKNEKSLKFLLENTPALGDNEKKDLMDYASNKKAFNCRYLMDTRFKDKKRTKN